MEILLIIGKVLFGLLFVGSGIGHIKNVEAMTGYAQYKNLPFPKVVVLVSGVAIIAAPVFFVIGIFEVAALITLAVFLAATAVIFHNYWTIEDPQTKMNEQISFNKNVALLGAVLVILALL